MPEDKLPVAKVIEGTPVTKNDAVLARRLNMALAGVMGADAVIPFEQKTMGAEDFAYFVQAEHKVPGYYFSVGGTPKAVLDAAEAGGPPVS
jgi:hippurate hydrolase